MTYSRKKRAVWQIDAKTGERLKQYASISDAAEAMPSGPGGDDRKRGNRITAACRGKYTKAFGFKWEYADASTPRPPTGHPHSRAIWKLDKDTGRRLKRYGSLKEATQSLSGKVHVSKLSKACRGRVPDAYGFRWEYDDDAEDDAEDEGDAEDGDDTRVDESGSEPDLALDEDPRKELAARVLQQLADYGAMMPTLVEPLQEIVYSEMKHPYLKEQQELVLGRAKTFRRDSVQDLSDALMWKDDLILHAVTLKEHECANMKKNLELQKHLSNEVFTDLREHICKTLPADILAEADPIGPKKTFKEFILTVIVAIAEKCTGAERFAARAAEREDSAKAKLARVTKERDETVKRCNHVWEKRLRNTEQKLKSVTEERDALASADTLAAARQTELRERALAACDQNEAERVEAKRKAVEFHKACVDGKVDVVRDLIKAGVDVNEANDDGKTPLYTAVSQYRVDVVRALIDAGADVNKVHDGWGGVTHLYYAANTGKEELVRVLIDAGADVNKADNDGETPLFAAVRHGSMTSVRALIDANKRLDKGRNDGETPLHVAALYGHDDVIDALIAAGADPTKKNADGITARDGAVASKQDGAVRAFDEAAAKRSNYTEFARMISRDKKELAKFKDAMFQVRIDKTEKEMKDAQRAVDASAEKLQQLKRKRVSINSVEDSL